MACLLCVLLSSTHYDFPATLNTRTHKHTLLCFMHTHTHTLSLSLYVWRTEALWHRLAEVACEGGLVPEGTLLTGKLMGPSHVQVGLRACTEGRGVHCNPGSVGVSLAEAATTALQSSNPSIVALNVWEVPLAKAATTTPQCSSHA